MTAHLDPPAAAADLTAPADQRALLWIIAALAALWTIVPALVHLAPPLDVVESAMWGREWVVGTYKHPGIPAWFIEMGRVLNGGVTGWPVYLTSQLFTVATLGLTYLLARDLAGHQVATAAVISLLGVEYFSWRAPEFNHTQAQMPFWIGAALCAWRAVDRQKLVWWLGLGAMAALGLYAKLSNAVLLLVIARWLLSKGRNRATLRTAGPWIGALTFAVLCVPLVRWLLASNFQALSYAGSRGQDQSLIATLLFPANTALQALPIVLTLALAGVFRRGAPAMATLTPLRPDARRYLLVIALAPPLLSVVLALIGRSGLRASWMAPALPLLAVLLLVQFRERLGHDVMRRLLHIGAALAVLIPLSYALIAPQVGRFGALPPLRTGWPHAEIATRLAAAWTAETRKPLRIVAGSAWAAGLVGIDHPDRPSILTDGTLAFAPWITPERLSREGALIVWTEGRGGGSTPDLLALAQGLAVHEMRVPVPRSKTMTGIVVRYAILPPR